MALAKRPRRQPTARKKQIGGAASASGAVAARGERTLILEGVAYRLRPSRAAVSVIEEETGLSALELARAGNTGGLGIEQLGVIAAEFIKSGAEPNDDSTRNVGTKRIGDLIFEEGIVTATAVLTLCLIDAVMGGRTAEGNVKAATA